MAKTTRMEKDSLGEVELPVEALYGASTQRALDNFPVSGMQMPNNFIAALGLVKRACAKANVELDALDPKIGKLIARAAGEIYEGKWSDHFPVDVFQTGSGTSTNMNVNEVIANRCSQIANKPLGSKKPVHPNDHVNLGQSSNDVIPTTLHVSVVLAIEHSLKPALNHLKRSLSAKAEDWKEVLKLGRTHLMDATPVTLGQEFSGYTRQLAKAQTRCDRAIEILRELAIGGTAVGTGINSHKDFGARVCSILSQDTGIEFCEAENHFEAQASRDDAVEVAGHLSAIASALTKIANDIRLLGSGPRSGLGELKLPPTQPGSSIMPGKVNPVMCEMLVQASHYCIGLCQTVTRCGQDGQLELNATVPLIAHCLLQSIEVLSNGTKLFADRCISDLKVDEQQCQEYAVNSLGLATALNPFLGYDKAAEVAKVAFTSGKSIQQVAQEMRLLDDETLTRILDPRNMTGDKKQ
jgi:fumarate hydratase, class II